MFMVKSFVFADRINFVDMYALLTRDRNLLK